MQIEPYLVPLQAWQVWSFTVQSLNRMAVAKARVLDLIGHGAQTQDFKTWWTE